MNDEEFARFVDLLHRGKGGGEEIQNRLLAYMRERVSDLTDDQLRAFLDLEKDYVHRIEEEMRRRKQKN